MTQDNGMWKKGAQFVRVLPLPLRKKRTMSLAFSLAVKIQEEKEHFVSECTTLKVWSYGDSEKEACENIEDAVGLFLETCVDMGTLDKVLSACGMTKIDEKRLVANSAVKTQIIKSKSFAPKLADKTEKRKTKEKVRETEEATMVHATA